MERPGGPGHPGGLSGPADPQQGIPVNLTDLYQMIGEREVVRVLQQKRITELEQEVLTLRHQLAGRAVAGGS